MAIAVLNAIETETSVSSRRRGAMNSVIGAPRRADGGMTASTARKIETPTAVERTGRAAPSVAFNSSR